MSADAAIAVADREDAQLLNGSLRNVGKTLSEVDVGYEDIGRLLPFDGSVGNDGRLFAFDERERFEELRAVFSAQAEHIVKRVDEID